MRRDVNKVILVGAVAADPQVHEDGTATVAMATVHGHNKRTDWHRLVFPSHLTPGVSMYVRKGSRLFVDGKIEYGSVRWDGKLLPTTDIVVTEYVILTAVSAPVADALIEATVGGDE